MGFLEEKQKCYLSITRITKSLFAFFAYINSASFSFAVFLFGFAEFFSHKIIMFVYGKCGDKCQQDFVLSNSILRSGCLNIQCIVVSGAKLWNPFSL